MYHFIFVHEQELPVLSRWFVAGTVGTPEAKFLDIILYRYELPPVHRDQHMKVNCLCQPLRHVCPRRIFHKEKWSV